MDNLGLLELDKEEIENVISKNQFIVRCQKEYLAIVDVSKMGAGQLLEQIQNEDMLSCGDVLAFCAGEVQDAVQLPLEDLLECFSLQIVALVFRRDLLAKSGKYNYRIQGMLDFEFLCRLTEANGNAILIFPGVEEDPLVISEKEVETCSYLIRRYLKRLHASNKMEILLQQMYFVMDQCGMLENFKWKLNQFLDSEKTYEKLAIATAPFVIMRGGDICHGVLQDFADKIIEELRKKGEAYLALGLEQSDYIYLMENVSKAIIGFQAIAFKTDFFKRLHGVKMQFWFDNPVFSEFHFNELEDDCYILCHDANYVEYIKEQYGKRNAEVFMPAGHDQPWIESIERPYDIIFIGAYIPETHNNRDDLEEEFYEYMIKNPDLTFSEGLAGLFVSRNIDVPRTEFNEYFRKMKRTCQNIINHFRSKIIETILNAGYEVHVYGESWKLYKASNANRLIIHPEVTVEESLHEWQKSKIGLNMMSWHKAGMTERIANIMLSGAACLSEETAYLKKHFEENEQIVTFQLSHLEKLPDKIDYLLRDSNWRRIAKNGYDIAGREHTWEKRTQELIELVEKII